jgi:flagellar hook-associated protein 3 FlgL
VVARVDQQIEITYGARANEEALRRSIQTFAVLAAESFHGSVETDKLRYEEMTRRAAGSLAPGDGRQTPQALQEHLAAQHHTLGKANERHTAIKGMAQELLASVEEADPHEVAVKLLQLQTRLEASYHTTAMLSKLSLVYYL